jgi:shikimate kinase
MLINAVKRILLTGMSGTGKSTLIGELAARGYKAIDADADEWSELVRVAGTAGVDGELDLLWREDRIQSLLSAETADVLFLSGCAPNQVKFYSQLDHIVLLTAPAPLIVERLATRTSNPYGKHPDEVARTLALKQTVEPLLRAAADLEIDTSAPIDQVVASVLRLVRPPD